MLSEVAVQMAIAVENALAYREIERLKEHLVEENLYLEDEVRHEFGEIVGKSRAMKRVLKLVQTVAATDSTVLLLGETGTGKELIARAVHNLSPRRDRTFVRISIPAVPARLIESELFGYEKGAFTGAATRKLGRMELAHGGTLFLDEIGDLPLELQPKLLRVLQEREFDRLGSTQTIRVDARIIAATNRDLERLVEDGLFRSDLYLPAQGLPDSHSTAARAARGHPGSRSTFHRPLCAPPAPPDHERFAPARWRRSVDGAGPATSGSSSTSSSAR